MVEAVQLLARTEAIMLDPVYTGKVMAGMIDLIRRGEIGAKERVLFLHTGGATALNAYEDILLGRVAVTAP
jgi:D-cysteine desulfhydrase